jgi:CBS domain-containing protein
MTFADLLQDDAIVVPLGAPDLEGALEELVGRFPAGVGLTGASGTALAAELAAGGRGDIVRVGESILIVLARVEGAAGTVAALGVSFTPVEVQTAAMETAAQAWAVLLLLTSRRLEGLREELVPALSRTLRDEERATRLLASRSPEDVRALDELMAIEFRQVPLVEDALTPLRYRIYPDTPLDEIVDLMVRRELHAVPVVGENLEVLGIISEGDILGQLLPGRRKQSEAGGGRPSEGPPPTARDIMTRTVMCVSEDQSLLEAGNLMMNREVEQLPVVREGELIGFVTRHAILRRIFGE